MHCGRRVEAKKQESPRGPSETGSPNFSVLAGVFRNDFGAVCAINTSQSTVTDPKLGEALALCMAAEVAISLGYIRVIFQCDNFSVVRCFKARSTEQHHKLEAARTRFLHRCSIFTEWDITFIARQCNFMVHNVAKWAKTTNTSGFLDTE
uniref:RNase H type-1 domain-containing protein n=1 Tax=Cannabis sativa TaxID=3483 RepID=A0A803QD08_CANSA